MMEHGIGWFSASPVATPAGGYCSPWCGNGCTRAQYDHAQTEAAKLADELGPAWEPDVWENIGWHWCATCDLPGGGHITVSPEGKGYSCLVGDRRPGGSMIWSVGDTFSTPQEAIRDEAEQALEVARKLLATAEAAARVAGIED